MRFQDINPKPVGDHLGSVFSAQEVNEAVVRQLVLRGAQYVYNESNQPAPSESAKAHGRARAPETRAASQKHRASR